MWAYGMAGNLNYCIARKIFASLAQCLVVMQGVLSWLACGQKYILYQTLSIEPTSVSYARQCIIIDLEHSPCCVKFFKFNQDVILAYIKIFD